MKFKPIAFPRGIANIFAIGLSNSGKVVQDWEFRPDKVAKGMKEELINNNLSNVSPISCKKGVPYKFASQTFVGWFGGI